MRYVEVQKNFQSTCKIPVFFQKNQFFQNFQNAVIKRFQSVSIQKKFIKIERTHYEKKVLSPKFFQKNQNWILNSGPKFSNFQKIVILHQMAKIAKKSKIK